MLKKLSNPFIRSLIKQHTKLCRRHLTPELQLHLITPECPLWSADVSTCPFSDPFWAFYWPGGQALTRYVFDNAKLFQDKRVLDIGSGCGSAALAAKLVGAQTVMANDIDSVSLTAIEMNMEANAATVLLDGRNLLTQPLDHKNFDFIFIGDMFYDPDFADMISEWLKSMECGISILIGDPGRLSFENHSLRKKVVLLTEYQLPETCTQENNGFTHGAVWKLDRSRR